MQTPVRPCVGCHCKVPLAWGGCCSIQGLQGKPLAALSPSDYLPATWPGSITTKGKDATSALPPSELSWWPACSLFLQCPHSRHVQWVLPWQTLPMEHRILWNGTQTPPASLPTTRAPSRSSAFVYSQLAHTWNLFHIPGLRRPLGDGTRTEPQHTQTWVQRGGPKLQCWRARMCEGPCVPTA